MSYLYCSVICLPNFSWTVDHRQMVSEERDRPKYELSYKVSHIPDFFEMVKMFLQINVPHCHDTVEGQTFLKNPNHHMIGLHFLTKDIELRFNPKFITTINPCQYGYNNVYHTSFIHAIDWWEVHLTCIKLFQEHIVEWTCRDHHAEH